MPKMTMADLAERDFDARRERERASRSTVDLGGSQGGRIIASESSVETPRSSIIPAVAIVALVGLLAARISMEMRKSEAKAVFDTVDVDGSGMLSSSEIAEIGTRLGVGSGHLVSAAVELEMHSGLSLVVVAQRAIQLQAQEALFDVRTIRALLWRATKLYPDEVPIEKLAEFTHKRAVLEQEEANRDTTVSVARSLKVHNNLDEPVTLYWSKSSDEKQAYGTIQPMENFAMKTRSGDTFSVWIRTDTQQVASVTVNNFTFQQHLVVSDDVTLREETQSQFEWETVEQNVVWPISRYLGIEQEELLHLMAMSEGDEIKRLLVAKEAHGWVDFEQFLHWLHSSSDLAAQIRQSHLHDAYLAILIFFIAIGLIVISSWAFNTLVDHYNMKSEIANLKADAVQHGVALEKFRRDEILRRTEVNEATNKKTAELQAEIAELTAQLSQQHSDMKPLIAHGNAQTKSLQQEKQKTKERETEIRQVNDATNKKTAELQAEIAELIAQLSQQHSDMQTLITCNNALTKSLQQEKQKTKELEKGIRAEFQDDAQVVDRNSKMQEQLTRIRDCNDPSAAVLCFKMLSKFLSKVLQKHESGADDLDRYCRINGRSDVFRNTVACCIAGTDMMAALRFVLHDDGKWIIPAGCIPVYKDTFDSIIKQMELEIREGGVDLAKRLEIRYFSMPVVGQAWTWEPVSEEMALAVYEKLQSITNLSKGEEVVDTWERLVDNPNSVATTSFEILHHPPTPTRYIVDLSKLTQTNIDTSRVRSISFLNARGKPIEPVDLQDGEIVRRNLGPPTRSDEADNKFMSAKEAYSGTQFTVEIDVSQILHSIIDIRCLQIGHERIPFGLAHFGAQNTDSRSVESIWTEPVLADRPLVNSGAIAGKFALAKRGTTPFDIKARWAQQAGAVGLIIVNDDDNLFEIEESAPTEDLTIPVLLIKASDGARLFKANGMHLTLKYDRRRENEVVEAIQLGQILHSPPAEITTLARNRSVGQMSSTSAAKLLLQNLDMEVNIVTVWRVRATDAIASAYQLQRQRMLEAVSVSKLPMKSEATIRKGISAELHADLNLITTPGVNETLAWHGSTVSGIKGIVEKGFVAKQANTRNAAQFGVGVYLSPVDHHSKNIMATYGQYSTPDADGVQHVLLCAVLRGNVERVRSGSNQFASSDGFHTAADSIDEPFRYIVFQGQMNSHIRPLFVVSFRVTGHKHDATTASLPLGMAPALVGAPTNPFVPSPFAPPVPSPGF